MKYNYISILLLIVLLFSSCNFKPDASIESSVSASHNTQASISPTDNTIKLFGFVCNVDDEYIQINECERVFHSADDIGPSGEEYGNDWLEIVHKPNKIKVKVDRNAECYYVDLTEQGTDYDGTVTFEKIPVQKFLDICMDKYYGNVYYFDFVLADNTIIKAEFYLDYYISG